MSNIYEIDNDKVVGFEKEAQTIINQLIHGSKEREVTLITGMGGLGKTTLTRRVYKEKNIVNYFDKRAWCTVSQEYDCKDLLNKIYSQVCGREIKMGSSVSEELHKSLMGMRYLIVLDDIWSLKAWEELNRAFPSCDNGSRVVITSRQESVVSDAKHICLPFFTIDESWELLQVKLFKGKACPKELENIGKEISKKCGGLPLVVGLVAGLLREVEKSEQMWQEVLNTLSSQVAFSGRIQSSDAIELSYNHLPDHLRPCLLYFAAIPEDETIVASKLINLWISEGFIDIIEKERVEGVAGDCLNHLVGSNLVMVSKRKYDGHILSCGVHDLVRDFCLTKAKDENFLHIIKKENVLDDLDPTLKLTPHRISLHICSAYDGIPNELISWNSSIGTLLCFRYSSYTLYDSRHNSSWVAKKCEHLTILDLEMIKMDISIMFEVNSLIHLRYLALNLCGTGSISPGLLENLECLITLKLTSEKDVHLPKYFWNMQSLRHMVIHHYCSFELCPIAGPSVMEPIPHGSEILQTLDLGAPLSIRDEHLLRKLSHLKNLRCGVSESYPFAEIDFLHALESLGLSGSGNRPHFLNDLKLSKFPLNVKEIRLFQITLSLSAISIIAQVSKLEALTLSHCTFDKGLEWNVDEETQFRKLKYLQLFSLHNIISWNVSSAAESFPCLEQLILNDCLELEELSYSFADITTLELISVVRCRRCVVSSVKEIKEELQVMGSEQLIVHFEDIVWWLCDD